MAQDFPWYLLTLPTYAVLPSSVGMEFMSCISIYRVVFDSRISGLA